MFGFPHGIAVLEIDLPSARHAKFAASVLRRKDGDHALGLSGLRSIDIQNFGMCIRTPNKGRLRHFWQFNIIGIFSRPFQKTGVFPALNWFSYVISHGSYFVLLLHLGSTLLVHKFPRMLNRFYNIMVSRASTKVPF